MGERGKLKSWLKDFMLILNMVGLGDIWNSLTIGEHSSWTTHRNSARNLNRRRALKKTEPLSWGCSYLIDINSRNLCRRVCPQCFPTLLLLLGWFTSFAFLYYKRAHCYQIRISCWIKSSFSTHTPVFNVDMRRPPLQSVAKIFRIFDLLAAQGNQLRNLIEDAIWIILLDMAISPSRLRSRRWRRIPGATT